MAKSTTAAKAKPSSRSTAKKKAPKASSKAKPSPKSKPASKAKPASRKAKAADETANEEVTIDRRRAKADRRTEESADAAPAKPLKPRKKVNRRRQIDPTTCERDYSDQEVEFMNALDEYKRTSGRMFPTCSEVLEVIRSLGYVQLSPAELAAREPALAAEDVEGAEADGVDAEQFEEDEAFDEAEEALV